jgi:hypothetical protein
MIRRWHHGHSLAAGAAAGLAAASYRIWLLLAVAFLAGGVTVYVLPRLRRAAGRLLVAAEALLPARERGA